MSELQSWRFLVSRNQFLDYRTVVAPDFMCQANIASLLAKAAEGDPTNNDCAYYREIHGSKVGELTVIYRVSEAQAKDINAETEGVLKDSFGREIYFIEGIVLKGIQTSLAITLESLEFNHQQLVDDYREFWEWVSPQSAIPSEFKESSICESVEDSSTLKRIDLPPYILGKKDSTLTKTFSSNLDSKRKNSDSLNNQKLLKSDVDNFEGEVHQCLFINDSEVIVYIRLNPVCPHDHKVVRHNLQTKHKSNLIQGRLRERSIERIGLASDSNILVSSNRTLWG